MGQNGIISYLSHTEKGLLMGAIAFFAVFIAYFVKGVAGFANTLIFSGIMNYFTTNINISPIELLLGAPSNVLMICKNRKLISAKVVVPISICMIAGMIPGTFFLKVGADRLLKIILGVVVIALGVEMLMRLRANKQAKASWLFMVFIGVLSGVLIGIFGIGAFLVAYISRTSPDTNAFKGNLSCVFFVDNVFRTILYAVTGILTKTVLLNALMLAPLMLAGFGCGMLVSKYLPEKTVKLIVIILLIVNGVSLIAMSL